MTDSIAEQAPQVESSARGHDLAPLLVRAAYKAISVWVATALLLLMALSTADVIGRYVFNRPIDGASEVIELLLGIVIFSALPQLTLRQEDVTIDLLGKFFRGWVESARRALITLVVATCYTVLAYKMWLYADYMRTSSHEITPILGIPIYPVSYLMSVLLAVSGVFSIAGSLGLSVKASKTSEVDDADV